MKKLYVAALMFASAFSAVANSPYIHRVYEYRPAPGQFIGEMPEYEEGDSEADMLVKAGEQLVGARQPGMVSLGAWGGYVTFGFDHPIYNKPGEPDFKIYGNALINDRDNGGGSAEPGIVMVSVDANGNGLPDDAWYELRGSRHSDAMTKKEYKVTYFAPESGHIATPDATDKYVTDTEYIKWQADNGDTGYLTQNTYHTQSYWPQWLPDEQTLSFEGTRLPDNYQDISGDGSYYTFKFFEWGYADNLPNTETDGFDIGNAIDSDGNAASLPKIDFVRVYTGVLQSAGRLGESSTEVAGAEDLHPDYVASLTGVCADAVPVRLVAATAEYADIYSEMDAIPYTLYNMQGINTRSGELHIGLNRVPLQPGQMQLLQSGLQVFRLLTTH